MYITDIVAAPPKKPSLTVAASTSSTIQINWRSGSNGGSRIQGFNVYFKKEHGDWTSVTLSSQNRSFTANGLRCGTKYMFHVRAFNRVGNGIRSETIEVQTNGSGE